MWTWKDYRAAGRFELMTLEGYDRNGDPATFDVWCAQDGSVEGEKRLPGFAAQEEARMKRAGFSLRKVEAMDNRVKPPSRKDLAQNKS
jgi:hypothetical protein